MAGARTPDQLGTSPGRDPGELLGDLVPPGPATLEPFPYAFGSPATGGLYLLRGEGWTWFCKALQHVRHWPGLVLLPPEHAASFAADFPWRSELEMWDEPWASTVPDGLRLPELHSVVDLGDDRLAVWMEAVEASPTPWDLDRYARAAHLLGRWNARCADPALLALSGLPIGHGLRMYAERAVPGRGLEPLRSDLWQHPWLVDHTDLRRDLLQLGDRIPAMLDRLDSFVQAMPHGDASPQNLLVPLDAPDTFVAIDVSFRTPHAVGFDLGQLLVGLVHAGSVPASRLPDIADRIVPAYLDGLALEGVSGHDDDVREAFATSVLLRSGFDPFLYEFLGSDRPEDRHAFDERIALSRFLVDQYGAL